MKKMLKDAQLLDKTIKDVIYITDNDGLNALALETTEEEICILYYESAVGVESYTPAPVHKFNIDFLKAATVLSVEEHKELKDKYAREYAKQMKANAERMLEDLKKSNPELFNA